MPTSRLPSQAPELSPTFPASNPQPNPTASSVRRNLFSTHLSRRPASSQSSQSQSLPPSQNQTTSRSPISSPFASHPRLQPTQLSMNDIYDPTVSPNHALSPSSSAKLFPGSSIIAVHPSTGRPILPNLPTLPGRLRLSQDDEDDGTTQNQQDPSLHHGLHDQGADPQYDTDLDDTYTSIAAKTIFPGGIPSTALLPGGPAAATASLLSDADDEQHDRERIVRLLAKILGRQRQRIKGKEIDSRGHKSSTTTDQAFEDNRTSHVGEEAETEELMGLIMTTLKKQVAVADEDAWMFGDAGNILGFGVDGIGVYD